MLFKLLFIRFEKKVCLAVASSKLKAMKAVFIDAIVYSSFVFHHIRSAFLHCLFIF